MRRIVCTAAFLAFSAGLVAGLAGCGSTTSGTHPAAAGPVRAPVTETIRAALTGTAAAKVIGSNSNAPLKFPAAAFSGVVTTRIAPFTLGGKSRRHGFKTPAGVLFVTHAKDKKQQKNPAVTGQAGRLCYFSQVFEAGTWKAIPGKSAGKFKDATGAGTYTITATFAAGLLPGKSKCSAADTGKPVPPASLVFAVTGPLRVK